ncbi:TIGR00730 family Rossman fold protein [Denitrobaculum tricleocarpae]|uniref:Cytokinin riboside 5'-monophosphate phosphoribohydrolase n=1 Tax=Denitrobaculum tricleocarpae TaxID=2591009 RepID=A0A545T208_9PROT|nr:TIGR00730 family Rossman fold protein [Denitrobaculum tricleocarpae]TQV71241.1 TIGR00730 family Rossman fold protein [Denitrobaculum tricleocarpae]
MPEIKALCIYCGASQNVDPRHLETADQLGRTAAEKAIDLVYGGGHSGMMGAAADGALSAGGRVIGIIPEHLKDREAAHNGVTEMVVVDSMHVRKQKMFERSDAFCVLPGGLGTLDETFEIITWKQLGLHDKPIVLLNLHGFWDPLMDMIRRQVEGGYLHNDPGSLFSLADDVEGVFSAIASAADSRVTPDSSRL